MFSNLAHLATDRRRLAGTDGLRFWRLMGAGRGRNTGPSADLSRRAVFAVWDDDAALDQFLDQSPVAAAWRAAEECWSVRLKVTGGHGAWRGRLLLDELSPAIGIGGPTCTITRANVHLRHWMTFARAARANDAVVRNASGLVRVVAVGEAPVGRQATFSVWENEDAMRTFVYRTSHAEVVARTRREGWYGEEMFARFEPYASTGSWDGVDPLATR